MRGWMWGVAAPETASAARMAERNRGTVSPPEIEPRKRPSSLSDQRTVISARGKSLTVSKVPIATTRSIRLRFGLPGIFHKMQSASSFGKQRTRIGDVDLRRELTQTRAPFGIRATDEQRAVKPPNHRGKPIETIVEGAFEEEQLGTQSLSPISPHRTQLHVEQLRHEGACALSRRTRQAGGGRRRPDGTPDRRCADDRQYRPGLRQSAATRGGVAG